MTRDPRGPWPPETFVIVDEIHHHPPMPDPPLAIRAAIRAAFVVADAGRLADTALYHASNAVGDLAGKVPDRAINLAEAYTLARWCGRSAAESLVYGIRNSRGGTVPNVTAFRARGTTAGGVD